MRLRLLAALALAATLGVAGDDSLEFECPRGSALREHGTDFACETPAGVGEGPFWTRRDDGTLRVWGRARAGRTEGRWLQFHPSGRKSIEANYRNGALVGRFELWDDHGQLLYAGTHDARGEMHGTWRRWWPNGRERMRWQMRHGTADGRVVAFWENGERRFEGRREHGRREGAWTWWDESGAVVARCRYERDAVVEGSCGAD